MPEVDSFVDLVKSLASGTVIPRPDALEPLTIKAWGKRRGEPALVCQIPNRKSPRMPHRKGVTVSELRRAYEQLASVGEFTYTWFLAAMPECAREASFNFTSIGSIFQFLGLARYREPGVYVSADP